MPSFSSLLAVTALLCQCVLASPHIIWEDCKKRVPVTLGPVYDFNVTAQTVLPSTLHCGRIEVPMDYSKPIGPNNQISVELSMYRPRKPTGLLFFCPGGTDAGAVVPWTIALDLYSNFTPNFDGLLEYDILALDIRGTWMSNALNVSFDTVAPLVGAYPSNEQEYNESQAAATIMFQSWYNLSSPPGIVHHVGTREVVQDYDNIRAALGYDKVHFLGDSYGSYRASQYAVTFPKRVGHFALDAVVPHGLDATDQLIYDIKSANRGLLRADAFCVNNTSCPLHKEGKGSVVQAWLTVLAKAENGTLSACDTESNCEKLSSSDVQTALSDLFSGQPDFPQLIEKLIAAVEGNGAPLVASPPTTIDALWGIPLVCNDNPINNPTWAGYQEKIQAAKKVDTYYIYRSQWLQASFICAAWPYKNEVPPLEPLELKPPMLLVTADFDVDQPTEKATFAWETAPQSALVVRHGDDHVSFQLPKQMSTQITKEFLRSGCLPPPENKTFVTVYEPGSERGPIPDPYEVPTGFGAGDIDTA